MTESTRIRLCNVSPIDAFVLTSKFNKFLIRSTADTLVTFTQTMHLTGIEHGLKVQNELSYATAEHTGSSLP